MGEPSLENELQEKLEPYNDNGQIIATRDEIKNIVRDVLESMSGGIDSADLKLYSELQTLINLINKAKNEIAEMRPDEVSQEQIAQATDELDAIVAATEEATGTILDCAEIIENVVAEVTPEQGEKLTEAVTKIYEASNFQDITGQRITKVVNTFKVIETELEKILAALGDKEAIAKQNQRKAEEDAAKEAAKAEDADLMNGPQLPGASTSQDDIDAMFD